MNPGPVKLVVVTTLLGFAACGGTRTDSSSEQQPRRFGDVVVSASDPQPPSIAPTKRLIDLTDEERQRLCAWVGQLSRPAVTDCPDDYYSQNALILACRTIQQAVRPECNASTQGIVGCAMAIVDCSVTANSLGACHPLQTPECAPDLPGG
jgi:hypothetical protein